MVILDEEKIKLKALSAKAMDCCKAFDLEQLKQRSAFLTEQQQSPDLYKDLKKAQSINSEAKYVENKIKELTHITSAISDLEELIGLVELENDEGSVADIDKALNELQSEIDDLHLATLLKGEYDRNNAIITIHAGAGGTEAQDWASMLYRMYRMYCDKEGFKVEETDYLDGDEAGLKSVTFFAEGLN